MRSMKEQLFRVKVTSVFMLILGAVGLSLLVPSHAEGISNFRPGRIMDDAVFTRDNSMNAGQIQSFLNSKMPNCDTNGDQRYNNSMNRREYAASQGVSTPFTCLKDYREHGKSAAQIINDAAKEFRINPQVLIVLLQKEQGLITDDWPWPVQYRTAAGYGCPDTAPCDSEYFGLTNQLRWAARMFRAIMNDSPTWYTPYNLGNNQIPWHPNSSCGTSTVNIQNRATKALYNYTPYRPNQAALNAGYGTGDNCSSYGNRNFYLYFRDWFGSTQTSTPYAMEIIGRSIFTDAGRTQRITDRVPTVRANSNDKLYGRILVRNTGYQTWNSSFLRLATANNRDRNSVFRDSSWLGTNRVARPLENSIAPGGTATFEFAFSAPQAARSYFESFGVVAESRSWLLGYATFGLSSTRPSSPANTRHTLSSGQSLAVNDLLIAQDRSQALRFHTRGLTIRNDFITKWSRTMSNAHRLTMQADGNLVALSASNQTLWASGTDGNPGARLSMQADGNLVIYNNSNNPIWGSGTSVHPSGYSYANKYLFKSQIMYPDQQIETPDRRYRFILQRDGNAVLYNAQNRAIWSTQTGGRNVAFMTLQENGNLVLRDTNGAAVWHARINNKGGNRFAIRDDGNLMVHNTQNNRIIWHTSTGGR